MEPQFETQQFLAEDISRRYGLTADTPKQITQEDLNAKFGKVDAAKINFVPQMLHALLMQKCVDFVNFCKEHRLRDFIKHTRLLKKCIEEHANELYRVYGHKYFRAYTTYVERYTKKVYTDIWLFQKGLEEASANQLPNERHREIAAMLTFIILLRRFAEEYDKQMDILISKTLNVSATQHQEPYLVLIEALVVDIADTFRYKLEINGDMRLWVKILAIKADKLCEEIFTQEEIEISDNN